MEVNLSVPYKSQWDADANTSRDNCGPTCIAMIANHFGKTVTTNEVFLNTGAFPNNVISVDALQKAIKDIGLFCNYQTGLSVKDLTKSLDNGVPVITLLHNGDLISRQDQNDTSGHFVVVVGYRGDGYFVNDPDFWGQYRQDGDHHFYTKAEFENAWADCHIDGNPDNSLLTIQSGTFIDTPTFTKLVTKATSLDAIGKDLNYPQDEIDAVGFGNVAIAKIAKLKEVAFTTPSVPEPVNSVSTQAPVVPQDAQNAVSTPVQPKQGIKTAIINFLKELINIKGGE